MHFDCMRPAVPVMNKRLKVSQLDEFKNLFAPGRIGTLNLKNRIVMSAMGTRYCGIWGEVTETLIEWYRRRAQGGCALVITESTLAATAVDSLRLTTLQLRADDTCYIPGLARLAEAIHESGAKAGVQLSAGGGAQAKAGGWTPGFQTIQELPPVSPSGVPGLGRSEQPRILSEEEIENVIRLCGNSAFNVKQAGFDLVEIHAHGGYLISQFLSPYFNKRSDKYGGSFENRCRFLLEIVRSMRNATGPDFPIVVKYSIDDFLPDSWDVAQSRSLAKELEHEGVSGIGISSGVHGSKLPATPPYFFPPGVFLPFAEIIKQVVDIPVLVGGRLNTPQTAESVLDLGKADFIYEGRALIADPDWPRKASSGRTEEIRPCLACNECRQCIVELQSVRCTVNAAAGREREYDAIAPAAQSKKVLIAGGGPGGMEAARVAALRGHAVTLCEKNSRLGGLMRIGGIHNEQISEYCNWLIRTIEKLPVEILLRTEVSEALVEKMKPDVLIIATGGTFIKPEIPGFDRQNVFSAQDLYNLMSGLPVERNFYLKTLLPLAKKFISVAAVRRLLESNLIIKKRVAVIGGQFPGCSLALMLAMNGKSVTILEPSATVGRGMEKHAMTALQNEAAAGNVTILKSAKIAAIDDQGVLLSNGDGGQDLIEADSVIVALELAPGRNDLAEKLRDRIKEIYAIGDVKSFQRIRKAVSEGYVAAFRL